MAAGALGEETFPIRFAIVATARRIRIARARLRGLRRVVAEVDQKRSGDPLAGGPAGCVLHVLEQLPVAGAHGPARAELPVQDVVRRSAWADRITGTRLLPSRPTSGSAPQSSATVGSQSQPNAI